MSDLEAQQLISHLWVGCMALAAMLVAAPLVARLELWIAQKWRDWFWLNKLKKRWRYRRSHHRAQMPKDWAPHPLSGIRKLP